VAADVPPKRRFTQDLRGVTSQKSALFIVTTVKTSNLTKLSLIVKLSADNAKKYLQGLSLQYSAFFLFTSPVVTKLIITT
jgi:hypothetical protein